MCFFMSLILIHFHISTSTEFSDPMWKMAAQIQKTVSQCIFCQIIAGSAPATIIHQTEPIEIKVIYSINQHPFRIQWISSCYLGYRLLPLSNYFDDKYIAFHDIRPVSDHHFLVIPKNHIENVKSLNSETTNIVKEMVAIGQELTQKGGGQLTDCRMGFHWPPFNSIGHLHLHVIFPESKINFLGRQIYRPKTFYFATPEATISWLQKQSASL